MITHKYDNWLAKLLFWRKKPGWQWAFTLGETVRYRYPDTGDLALRRHEEIHVEQYRRHGIPGFLWRYFVVEWRVPYRDKSFEVEARLGATAPPGAP
jgi:hypothetical protein